MTNEKMIAALENIARNTNGYNSKDFEYYKQTVEKFQTYSNPFVMIAGLIADLKADAGKTACKKAGKATALAAAQRILKNASRDVLHYAAVVDGKQYICDGNILISLDEKNALPLPEVPDDMKTQIPALDRLLKMNSNAERGEMVELPDIVKLKSAIKVDRQIHKGEKGYTGMTYDFGVGGVVFSAQYLVNIMECLPNVKTAYMCKYCIYMVDDASGDCGILMGIRGRDESERKKTVL